VHIQGTFSAHSGNVQCTFWERSVHIQGTFNAHSGNVQCTFGERSMHIQGTFNAHSGNVQCTFGERSMHIWGTFSVHSVRVEVDAREPPSQLKEALKESIKIYSEYNLPTWIPKTGVNKTKRRSVHI
jgi:hypothetical protein